MYNLYIKSKKTTDFGAPYHFRVCAKMVWGRSISTADTKRAPDFSEALGGCSAYLSSCCSRSATLLLMRSRIKAMRSSSTEVLDTLKRSFSR